MARQATTNEQEPSALLKRFGTLDGYIDAAKTRQGWARDAEVARAVLKLGLAITHWRTGRSYPRDEVMAKLATLAGADPSIAILQLKAWTARTPEMAALWLGIIERVDQAHAVSTAAIAAEEQPTAPEGDINGPASLGT